jgi:hypothetical protein
MKVGGRLDFTSWLATKAFKQPVEVIGTKWNGNGGHEVGNGGHEVERLPASRRCLARQLIGR